MPDFTIVSDTKETVVVKSSASLDFTILFQGFVPLYKLFNTFL